MFHKIVNPYECPYSLYHCVNTTDSIKSDATDGTTNNILECKKLHD